MCDTFKNCEGLSRVAFMDGNGVVLLGKVEVRVQGGLHPPDHRYVRGRASHTASWFVLGTFLGTPAALPRFVPENIVDESPDILPCQWLRVWLLRMRGSISRRMSFWAWMR